jgi:hypothetical protein
MALNSNFGFFIINFSRNAVSVVSGTFEIMNLLISENARLSLDQIIHACTSLRLLENEICSSDDLFTFVKTGALNIKPELII